MSASLSGRCSVFICRDVSTCSEHGSGSLHVVNRSSRGRAKFSSRGIFSGLSVKRDCLVVSVSFWNL